MKKTLFLMGILSMVASSVALSADSHISQTVTVSDSRTFSGNLSVGTYQGDGALIINGAGHASTEYSLFIGGKGYWSPGTVPADYAAGSPHAGTVTVAKDALLTIGTNNGGQPLARQIVVGGAAAGTLNIAGTVQTPGVVYVRNGAVNVSSTGLLQMSGSGSEGLVVGEYKNGYTSASNGSVVIDGGTAQIGYEGPGLYVSSNVTIGNNRSTSSSSGLANGSVVVRNGGTLNAGMSLVTVGYGTGAVGTLDIQSGSRMMTNGQVQVGQQGAIGFIKLSGANSALNVLNNQWLALGDNVGSASLDIGAGASALVDNLSLGSSSTTVVASGGTLQVLNSAHVHAGAVIQGDMSYGSTGDKQLCLVAGAMPTSKTVLSGQISGVEHVSVEGGLFVRKQGFANLKTLNVDGGNLLLGVTKTDQLTATASRGLTFLIDRNAVEHGSVIKAGSVQGFGSGKIDNIPSISFDMSSYGLDLIGRKVEFIEDTTNRTYIRFDNTMRVENLGTIANAGTNTFDDGTTKFDYDYTLTGIAFKNRLTTTIPPDGPEVDASERIETEFVLGDTKVSGNTVIFTPDLSVGISGRPVPIASQIATDNLLEAATTFYTRVYTTVTKNPDGSSHVVIDRQPLDRPADVTVLVRHEINARPVDGERAFIGNTALGQQVNYFVVTSAGDLTLNHTDVITDKRIDAFSGSKLTLDDSTIVVGGSQEYLDGWLHGSNGKSTMEGTTLSLSNGSSLTTKPMAYAATSVTIKNSTVNFGATGRNVITAGKGAPVSIVNSSVNGNGVLNGVTMDHVVVTPVNASAGANRARSLSLNNTVVSNSRFNYDLGNVAVQSGGMNQFTLYLLGGAEQLNNVQIAVNLTPGQEQAQRASLTDGTSFRLFEYGEGGSFTGTLVSDPSLLPQLDAGLIWDLDELSSGLLSVIWEPIGDGQRIANTLRSAAMSARNFGQTALSHAADFRHQEGKNLWFSGLGYFDNAGNHNGRTGYEYNMGGYAVGVDRTFDRTTIGFAFGQTFGTNKPKRDSQYYTAGKIDQDGKLYGLYGRQIIMTSDKDMVYVDGYAMTGTFDNKSEKISLRNGKVSSAKWKEDAYSLGLRGTWRHEVADATYIKPFAGVDYTASTLDKFTETNGSISSTYDNGSYSTLTGVVGVGIERTYALNNGMELAPEVSVSYVGDISRNDGKVDYVNDHSSIMTDYAVAPGRSAVQLDAVVNWKISERWGARAGYGYAYRSGANSQIVSGMVSYAF